ncbi:light-regulated signal transduction histidine kinase (bacteriophytochrome) [Pontibacter aydingkolensis]|uniref:GAF domain-containing protein n=1 Tax=Pontibacter aydingkolensis TaxID=1911536 RepID=A0ABS7CX12_9BACT|nr:GAF domain-containing protein [Pontibacter aydingkolensis]MBW7468404.1 GAF domain-containing protein [Pontibacter aydingkolensis]
MNSKAAPVNLTIDKDYDSEICGTIPLHLVNLIQPHGALLVLDKQMQIVQASENINSFLPLTADELLSKPLSELIPANQYEDIVGKINARSIVDKIPFTLNSIFQEKETSFTALILPQDEYLLIELEENNSSPQETFVRLYQHIKYITSLLKQAGTCQEIAQRTAEELKLFTGFDRVLVYQFDPKWNGMVVGQAKEDDMDDYMGLRFPASDVPRQARDLYLRNPYRLIPTRDYTPVRLIPVINPITQRFTDLADSNLRSVAKVHLEYLANLKVMASMSLPIIIDNKLWGLISCHHKTPKYPGYEMRSAMELLGGILSAQLESKQKEEYMSVRVQLRSIHVKLVEQLYATAHFAEGLLKGATSIQDLLSLNGAAVVYEGSIWTSGSTPAKQEIKELVSWLRRNKGSGVFATDMLPLVYPNSKAYKETASGLVSMPVNANQEEFILGFRQEALQTVNWGGNPDNAIQMESDGKTYHPRNSFATYKEIVKNTAMPWQQEEIEAAETLRNAVLEKIIKAGY